MEPRGRSPRLSSRRTLTWRTSAFPSSMLVFCSLILLLATYAHLRTLPRHAEPSKRREGLPCPGGHRLTVLRVPLPRVYHLDRHLVKSSPWGMDKKKQTTMRLGAQD